MAVPNSPLHDHRPHTLAISSGGFESYNSSLSSESKMLKSSLFNITPSVHERSVPDPSNFIPFGRHPLQTASQPNFTPLFTWLDQQHLGNDGRAFQDYNAGQNFTDTPIHNPCGSFENQNPTECEAWEYGTPRGSAHSTTSSMAWEDRSFQSPHDVTTPFQMDSNYIPWPFHPLPPGPGQEHLAGTSIVADTMNQTYKQRSSDAPAFDAADSSGPAMYTTTMNHHVASQPSVEPLYQDVEDRMTFDSYDTGSESAKNEPPYAKLIYKALMDAPEHKLILRDIYAWISNNTDKAKDPAFKGWQNSVRHNLSMNGAFRKVPHVDPANKHKKGFIWVLESSAIGKGIESTTRYRQKTVWRRNDTSDVIDTKRQRSGRKGGRAARQSAKLRRSAKLDSRRPRRTQRFEKLESDSSSNASFAATRPTSPGGSYCHLGGLPYYLNTAPTKSFLPGRALDNYRKTVVSTSLPTNQTFFGNAPNNNDIYQGNKSAGIQGISGLAAHT